MRSGVDPRLTARILFCAGRADVIHPLVAMAGLPTTIGTAGECPRTRPARCATGDSAAPPPSRCTTAPPTRGSVAAWRSARRGGRCRGAGAESRVTPAGRVPVHRPEFGVVRGPEPVQVGRRGDPPAPRLDVVLLGVGRDDPVVHGRQEPAAGRVTAQYEAV